MTLRIGYLLPSRESIMEGRPKAEPRLNLAEHAEQLGYEEGARYLVLRCAGDHERHLDTIAKLRKTIGK